LLVRFRIVVKDMIGNSGVVVLAAADFAAAKPEGVALGL